MAVIPVPAFHKRIRSDVARIRRVKRLDRFATSFITLSGLSIIAAVLFIFLFIIAEAWPLFRPAEGRSLGTLASTAPSGDAGAQTLAFGVDEYQRYLYRLLSDGRVVFVRVSDGSVAKEQTLESISGATVTAASRSLQGDMIALGTADGRVALAQIRFHPRYQERGMVDLDMEVRDRGAFDLGAGPRVVRDVDFEERDGRSALAAQVSDREIVLLQIEEDQTVARSVVTAESQDKFTSVGLGRTSSLVAGTDTGRLYHWDLETGPRLTEAVKVSDVAVTAVEYALGGNSVLVGDASGAVSGWFQMRRREQDTVLPLVRAHVFPSLGTPIRAIQASTRDRSFAVAGADGSVALQHLTSERTLLRFPGTGTPIRSIVITPRMDGILAEQEDGRIARFAVSSPHSEFSWRSIFGKVFYEGYPKPAYVWQSTGATDDFEIKLSLVPIVFGTIKGTFYALVFAVPLAVMGALYTSQFVHPLIRAKVKPTVEIMAALPSVVIGFIAGLWLASRVEREVVPVLLMLVLMPLCGTAGLLLWQRLPRRFADGLKPGMEIFLIVPLVVVGALLARLVGPSIEGVFFGADFEMWLKTALDLVYDQRNCLVVGIAMGFAVIPIIFTISEDAFSSVPAHLTAASLALGASRWQTAVRVVLPTASPGIFSAVMVGFGRAVGETMIVLMATGNTPVLDWSIFNGMRTLAANIAVEVPEAPHGGTLYRLLFLSGGVLFIMTFIVNTVAEVIRQRLRERYKAL